LPDAFLKADVAKVDESLGLVFGWGIVCKVDGEPYFDLQGDHIPEDAMLKATSDFMLSSRISGDLHVRDEAGAPVQDGDVVFSFPLTSDTAKAMGISCDRTGWMVAIKPSAEVLGKYISGEYTGFSIGGQRVDDEYV
jgi:Putative phage serine protease XkdF